MCIGLRTTVWKFLFYGFVIAVWVAAAAHISIGIYLAVENPTINYGSIYSGYDKEVWDASVYLFISAGACLVGLAFVGCCGAWRPSNCLLWTFSVTMLVFIAIEMAVVIMAGVFQGDIRSGLRDTMELQVINDYVSETATDDISKDWNSMQKDLKCCAANYYVDYYFYNPNFDNDKYVPYTCCDGEQTNYVTCLNEAKGNVSVQDIQYLYRDGCWLQMKVLVEDQTSMIVATGCIVAAIQFGAFLFGCLLRDNLKKTGRLT